MKTKKNILQKKLWKWQRTLSGRILSKTIGNLILLNRITSMGLILGKKYIFKLNITKSTWHRSVVFSWPWVGFFLCFPTFGNLIKYLTESKEPRRGPTKSTGQPFAEINKDVRWTAPRKAHRKKQNKNLARQSASSQLCLWTVRTKFYCQKNRECKYIFTYLWISKSKLGVLLLKTILTMTGALLMDGCLDEKINNWWKQQQIIKIKN